MIHYSLCKINPPTPNCSSLYPTTVTHQTAFHHFHTLSYKVHQMETNNRVCHVVSYTYLNFGDGLLYSTPYDPLSGAYLSNIHRTRTYALAVYNHNNRSFNILRPLPSTLRPISSISLRRIHRLSETSYLTIPLRYGRPF